MMRLTCLSLFALALGALLSLADDYEDGPTGKLKLHPVLEKLDATKRVLIPIPGPARAKGNTAELPTLKSMDRKTRLGVDEITLQMIEALRIVQIYYDTPPEYLNASEFKTASIRLRANVAAKDYVLAEALAAKLVEAVDATPADCVKDVATRLPAARKFLDLAVTQNEAEKAYLSPPSGILETHAALKKQVMYKYDGELTERAKKGIVDMTESLLQKPMTEAIQYLRFQLPNKKYLIRAREESEDQK